MTAAKPEVSRKKSFNFGAVWFIPLVAVILGAWVILHNYMTEGPEIEISFKTAESLAEGKTKVKFRNVEMGTIEKITLSEDLKGVTAIVKLDRQAIPLIGEDTKFWVVRARVGGGGISGLDTLLSGAYIELSPATKKSKVKKFVALEKPPLTEQGAPGLRLVLIADKKGSVGPGDPILFKGFKVGRIENLTFDTVDKKMHYDIFIDAPYHELINSSVRFWNVSGITVEAGGDGLKVVTGSLETVLIGGVTFGLPPRVGPGDKVDHGSQFKLYGNYEKTLELHYEHRMYFVVEFLQSLEHLLPGAKVRYRGIEIGEVEKIQIHEHLTQGMTEETAGSGLPIPVLIFVEAGRTGMPDTAESLQQLRDALELGVKHGLRATLAKASLLGGSNFIELDFYPTAPEVKMGAYKAYQSIPTLVTGLSEIETKLNTVLDKINNLPLEKTVNTANQTLEELDKTVVSIRALVEADSTRDITVELQASLVALRSILEEKSLQNLPGEIDATLAAAQATLAAAQFQLKGDSSEVHQLGATLREVEAAARSLREFLDVMERNPESLIRGKKSK